MLLKTSINSHAFTLSLLFPSVFVPALFILQGSIGFSLWDEGFLWYGAQRVLAGEVPIRDFMAYDPGRYYWSALFMWLLGDSGLLSLRLAIAGVQYLGLVLALYFLIGAMAGNHLKKTYYLFFSTVILVSWMLPHHKIFDICISLTLLAAFTALVRHHTPKRYFIAGVCIGMAAVFGRNHGVYGIVSSLGILLWIGNNRPNGPNLIQALVLLGSGILIGYTPIIAMMTIFPGFTNAFWQSILFLIEQKSTNLPLPVPWPCELNHDK